MASNRISATARIELQNVAEREIMRFADNDGLWHKHIHNVELDAMQLLKSEEMKQHKNTTDCSCRRSGKTAVKELFLLKFNACNQDQEGGIVAPREAQSLTNLSYHTDAIRRSDVLQNFIAYKSGRKQLADTYYEFANHSKVRAYGIYSQCDGGDLTWASLEEVDDMPAQRLYSNFLLMMGSNRRLGASKESRNDPQIRITGVYKGADTLTELIDSGVYHNLPTVNYYLGIELGIIQEEFCNQMRKQLSPDEFIRQLLCQNISAKNLIWEKHIRRAISVGVKTNLNIEEPLPSVEYKKRGLISFGYDASGHGESATASKHALVVGEQIGNYTVIIYCKTWPAGTDDNVVKKDLIAFWRYFKPDYALGDAFGVGMLTSLNDDLFTEGLTSIDRRAIGGGDSTASTWPEWPFSPLRFEGMVKHNMAQALRAIFHNGQVAIPYVDHIEEGKEPAADDMRLFIRQLSNIKSEATKSSYSSYKMLKASTGDDLFDAAMAMIWGFVTRGAASVPTIITSRTTSRAALLGSTNT